VKYYGRNYKAGAKVSEFLNHIKNRRLLIQTHDVPDPDALASAEAFRVIAKEFGIKARIIVNGFPNRRENRALLRECKIKIRPLESVKIQKPSRYAWIFIDCLPGGGNVTLHKNAPGDVFMAIDHHVKAEVSSKLKKKGIYITDPNTGATATILCSILLNLDIPFPPRLASALSYAIITDTMDFSRGTTRADLDCFSGLFPKTNQKIISRLRNASKQRQYFNMVHKSLVNANFYRQISWVFIGAVESGEIVAEMADFILSCERITWSLALGYNSDRLYLSLRSTNEKANCGKIIHKLAWKQKGAVGGHNRFAGGFIELDSSADAKEGAKVIIDHFIRIILRIPQSMDMPVGAPLVANEDNYPN